MDGQMWSIETIKYHSAIKRNEVLTHATMWVNLRNIVLVTKDKVLCVSIYVKCPEWALQKQKVVARS